MTALVRFPPGFYQTQGRNAFANFAPGTSTFDLGNARALMWMSQLAYENDASATIDLARSLWGFNRITPFRRSGSHWTDGRTFDARGVIAEHDAFNVIAFEGTDALIWRSVWTDLDAIPSPVTHTHPGFQNAADAVWDDIKGIANSGTKPTFFTGHSLGAAIATIASDRAASDRFPPKAVYLFGAPRAGVGAFRDRYNAALGDVTYRLVHGNDIVPCVPQILGYHHIGQRLSCAPGARFRDAGPLSPTTDDNPRAAHHLIGAALSVAAALLNGIVLNPPGPSDFDVAFRFLPPFIRDHLQDRYIDALA